MQKEVERIQTEIKNLKTPLDAAGQERKRSLELQVDHLIDQTKVMLAGAGVDVSKDLRGAQNAPLETKLKVLDGFKRHMGDVLHKKDQEIADLHNQRTQLQGEQDRRLNRKQEISANLEKINSKIQSAMETQQKVAAHIDGLKPEIQELRKQLKQLREEMEQSKKVPGDKRNPNSQRGQLDQELKMKERQLESRLNRLIDQTGSVLRDAVKELTGVNPHLDTSTVRNASPEAKLKALEGSVRDLSDLVNGTSKSGEVVVSIGGSDFTAQGLKDYVAKLQNLQKQLRSEQRKLEE